MNNLVELSSGVDSLGALLLAMEKYPHHNYTLMHLQIRTTPFYSEKPVYLRWLVQLSNSIKITEGLKKLLGDTTERIKLITPIIQIPYILGLSCLDITYYRFLSGIITSNQLDSYTYIIKGVSSTDCIKGNMILPEFGPSNVDSNAQEDDIILAAVNKVRQNNHTEVWRPGVKYSKRELYDKIPETLKAYIWYCDSPTRTDNTAFACGKCSKCLEAEEFDIVSSPSDLTNVLEVEQSYLQYLGVENVST